MFCYLQVCQCVESPKVFNEFISEKEGIRQLWEEAGGVGEVLGMREGCR